MRDSVSPAEGKFIRPILAVALGTAVLGGLFVFAPGLIRSQSDSRNSAHFGPAYSRQAGLILEDSGARYKVGYGADKLGRNPDEQARLWWTELPWDKDDRPYAEAQAQVDREFAYALNKQFVVNKYRARADAAPTDALAFFRWMAAAWNLSSHSPTRAEGEKALVPIGDRVYRVQFPQTYQYARLAFLTQAFLRPVRFQENLGKRLLEKNPQDEAVRFYMIRVASSLGLDKALQARGRREALAYLAYFQQRYPNESYYDREEAGIHAYFWRVKMEGRSTTPIVKAYQTYLSKNPDAPDKAAVLEDIRYFNQQQELEDWSIKAAKAKKDGKPVPEVPLWLRSMRKPLTDKA